MELLRPLVGRTTGSEQIHDGFSGAPKHRRKTIWPVMMKLCRVAGLAQDLLGSRGLSVDASVQVFD